MESNALNIFVTGGTGFLGERLIRSLVATSNHTVFALARSETAASKILSIGAVPIRANLTDAKALQQGLSAQSIEIVFHLAAEIASQRNKSKLRIANVDGTQYLFDAVKNITSLKKFIFVSTVVTGEENGTLLEEHNPLHVDTEYGRSKQWGEKMLLEAFMQSNFPALVLRPCHIYGAGGWFADVVSQLRKGQMRIPGDGKNWWDVVYVDDVTQALIAVMEKGDPGEIFHVCDGHPVTMADFVAETAAKGAVKNPGRVPRWLANIVLGRDTVTSVVRSAKTSNTKLKNLGWLPKYPNYHAGLTRTFAELNQHSTDKQL
ncbi:MAG: nucleoside-diphosphate-sugar epimerase [Gammaproteobacteria bacterium]|jgi:nucleoside-diphosphate-sugar epimerase